VSTTNFANLQSYKSAMTSFQSLPTDVFIYALFPFLGNQEIFSLYKSCTYFKHKINKNIMSDLRSIYIMSIIIDDTSSSYKCFFAGRSLDNLQKIIKNYINSYVYRCEAGIRNYTITKIKFGSQFNVSNIIFQPVKKFSHIKKKEFPPLYGTHNYLQCYTFISKLSSLIYIIIPDNNTQPYPHSNMIKIVTMSLVDTIIVSRD
jgi:hypothetical protein